MIFPIYKKEMSNHQVTVDHALLNEAQFGFRPTYSTTDANYTLYSLVNGIRKKNCIVHLLSFQQHLIQSTETYYMIVS